MKIRTLTLKNFRSHTETVLELDRFNFIRGPNGCGKSSIQMALEYLFTGRCVLTDAAGRGAEVLIRSGEKELEVSAILESGETICRRRTSRSQVVEINGKRVPLDAAETFLTKQFGSLDVLSAVLNADRFVEMSEAEQQRLLAQLVDARKVEISAEIRDAVRAINEEPPRLASVGDVEAAHKYFYALRTEAGRALKALGQMEKPNLPSDSASAQDLRNRLQELRQQKERLIAQKAEADACWQNAQARLTQAQSEIEDASSEILSPGQEQELQLESERGRAGKVRHDLTELTVEQRTVEKSLATAQAMRGKCPTCWQPLSEAAKAKEVERLRARLSDLEGLIQGVREELNEFGELEAVTARLGAHRRALARRAKLIDEQSRTQTIERPDAADLESRIVILTERINKGERILEKAQQSEVTKERWEAYVHDKAALETRICLLDRLIAFFGLNGAMMERARGRLEPFQEKLNRQFEVFGYACNLILEPFEIRIISSNRGGVSLRLKQLSESERFRFHIAFQLAVATATGIRFVVMDRADVLDKQRRKLLTALLLHSDVEQAIVLATGEEPPPSIMPQEVKFLSLADGMKREPANLH